MASYRRDMLDEKSRELYGILGAAMAQHEEKVDLGGKYSRDEVYAAFRALKRYDERLFWVDDRFAVTEGDSSAVISYRYDKDTAASMQSEIDAEAASILAGTEDMSEGEKVQHIHDELVLRINYGDGEGENDNDIYGALGLHKCTCQGYAKAFVYLCRQAGIDAMVVEGVARDVGDMAIGDHMWDIVSIDGKYYHIDPTWDDPEDGDRIRYDIYGLDDEEIRRSRTVEEGMPVVDGQAYDWYERNLMCAANADEARDVILRQAEAGEPVLRVRADSKEAADQIEQEILSGFGEGSLAEILSSLGMSYENVSYSFNDTDYIFEIYMM